MYKLPKNSRHCFIVNVIIYVLNIMVVILHLHCFLKLNNIFKNQIFNQFSFHKKC